MHFYDTGTSLAIWTLPYVFIFTRRPPLATIRVAGPGFPVWPQDGGLSMRRVLLIEEHEEPLSRKQEMKIAIQYKNSSLLIPMRWREKVLRSQTTETLLLIRFGWIPSIALYLLDGLLWWKADSKSQCSFYSWISTSINNGIIDNKPELIKVISFLQLQLDQC